MFPDAESVVFFINELYSCYSQCGLDAADLRLIFRDILIRIPYYSSFPVLIRYNIKGLIIATAMREEFNKIEELRRKVKIDNKEPMISSYTNGSMLQNALKENYKKHAGSLVDSNDVKTCL